MILEAMNGAKSPWAKSESEFAQDFELANEYRAIRDRESFEHELAPAILKHLGETYDIEPAPISKIQGEKLGLLVKKYIAWCAELGIVAIPGNPLWCGAYYHELREGGASDADLRDMSEAISRAHLLHGYADPTKHPIPDGVLANQTKEEKTMAYETPKNVDQGVTKNGEKLTSRKQLEVDPPSPVAFWDEANVPASGDASTLPNFSQPHGGKSKGK